MLCLVLQKSSGFNVVDIDQPRNDILVDENVEGVEND